VFLPSSYELKLGLYCYGIISQENVNFNWENTSVTGIQDHMNKVITLTIYRFHFESGQAQYHAVEKNFINK